MKATDRAARTAPGTDGSQPCIRPALPDEAETLRDIAQRAYAPYVERLGVRPAPMDADYDAKIAATEVAVATLGGEVVGYVVLVPAADHLLVENLAVVPAQHQRGIGRRLLEHADATARGFGLPELQLYTSVTMTENLEIYPRLGYVEFQRRTDRGFERVFFRKPVSPAPADARPACR